jgi:hypothetical protein
MIILYPSSSNQVCVNPWPLNPVSASSLYLWTFQSLGSKAYINTLTYDSSSYPYRYSLFTITTIASGSVDPTQGQIKISVSGDYLYWIYTSPSGSLNSTGLQLCEQGYMNLSSGSVAPVYYTSSNNTYTIYGN